MSEKQLLSVDIEIANVFKLKPRQDLEDYAPFDISVAATGFASGECKAWFTVDRKQRPKRYMAREQAAQILEYLSTLQDEGVRVAAWNGVSFDLRWIGHVARNMKLAGQVALRSYDPMLQFFWARGFPVSLAKVGEAMGVKQQKLMHGSEAPLRWKKGDHKTVIEYVVGDVQITNQVVEAIESARCIRWINTRGDKSRQPITELLPAYQVLRQPFPDQSWMDSPINPKKFYRWIPKTVLRKAQIR